MMHPRRSFAVAAALSTLAALSVPGQALAQQGPGLPGSVNEPGRASTVLPSQLEGVSFRQQLNAQLPLDTRFRDEHGASVALGSYFGRKPVVLAFVYYECPMLCMQVLNGVAGALKAVPFEPGEDFDVVYISFDPRDTPAAAAAKKAQVLEDYKLTATASGWHFLTGDEASIRAVTAAAGFSYKWDDGRQQFAHVSGVLVATPDGRLSRYFYGIEYSPKELRMALVESGKGTIGGPVDQILLYCYHYDPAAGRYGAITMNIVRLGGALTVLILGAFIWVTLRKESAVAHA
ncbi:MAG: SCO family protein [Vicinamibacterales bacterium]|nr:SCO family protein [Vicinamibacterales bacterium]